MAEGGGNGTGERLSLDVPPHAEFIAMARMFAGAVARHFWCDEDTVDDIKIAISEAVTNAIKAHSTAASSEPVAIRAHATGGRLAFEVVDHGPGIGDEHLDPATSITPPGGLYEGSLGLTVIRSLFDDAQISRHRGPGTSVTFSVPVKTAEV